LLCQPLLGYRCQLDEDHATAARSAMGAAFAKEPVGHESASSVDRLTSSQSASTRVERRRLVRVFPDRPKELQSALIKVVACDRCRDARGGGNAGRQLFLRVDVGMSLAPENIMTPRTKVSVIVREFLGALGRICKTS
jgi:hypothetical protein